MYFEEAEVKKYTTKNQKTGVERTSFQIHLKKDSKFREPKKIGLINLSEVKKIETFLEDNPIEEKEAEINELLEVKVQLEKELQQLKAANEKLTSENKTLKEEKIQLQKDLLTEKNNAKDYIEEANTTLLEAKDNVINLQNEQKKEVKELNSKLEAANDKIEKLLIVVNNKDNDIVYLAKRGLGSRIVNKLTERIEATLIEFEAKSSEE